MTVKENGMENLSRFYLKTWNGKGVEI